MKVVVALFSINTIISVIMAIALNTSHGRVSELENYIEFEVPTMILQSEQRTKEMCTDLYLRTYGKPSNASNTISGKQTGTPVLRKLPVPAYRERYVGYAAPFTL